MKAVIKRSALVVGLSLMGVMASQAATISYDVAYPAGFPPTVQSTNFSQTLVLPLFNPTLGTLTKVTLTQTAGVSGSFSGENTDIAPATITLNLQATSTVTAPGGITVVSLPIASSIFNASAYDGTTDFGGTSGTTVPFTLVTDTDSTSSTNAAILNLYKGVGTFSFNLAAVGASTASGAGNGFFGFSTRAGASITVTYDYNLPPSGVPEPATYFMMGSGLLGLVFLARRRNRS